MSLARVLRCPMCVSFSLKRRFFSASSPSRLRRMRLWCAQAEGQTSRTRFTFRNSAATGASATTLTFSTAPGAQAKAAAKVWPGPALERMLRLPQMSSCMTRTLPDSTRPMASAESPARSRKASFGKRFSSGARQESIAVSSPAAMPEKSGADRTADTRSFIKILFR